MAKLLRVASCLAIIASTAAAEPSGRFQQAHEVISGSSLYPNSKGRVFQITEKVMNRLVRLDMNGLQSPEMAVGLSDNQGSS